MGVLPKHQYTLSAINILFSNNVMYSRLHLGLRILCFFVVVWFYFCFIKFLKRSCC